MFDFNASLNDAAPVSPNLFSVGVKRKEKGKSVLLVIVFCVSSFFLSSRPRSSLVSVVFDFSDSLNDVAPVSPMLLPVDVNRKGKSVLLMDVFLYVFFLLSSPFRSSSLSVVFDFNNSPNDVVPDSPTLFPFDVKRNEKSDLLRCVFCVSSFVFTK